jgi:hypothetical protein
LIVDHGVEQVIRADRPEWVPVFTGLSVGQFQELVSIVAGRGGDQSGAGRRWGLLLADRVLLTTVYYRTNLTFRQIALQFGISKSAAHRVAEHVAPLLVLPPVTGPHSPDTVLIVDGTLVPTHDRSVSASSKNYRYSANMQVVIDANTRLGVAVGTTMPGNRTTVALIESPVLTSTARVSSDLTRRSEFQSGIVHSAIPDENVPWAANHIVV